jgi:hypothetical protein
MALVFLESREVLRQSPDIDSFDFVKSYFCGAYFNNELTANKS